MAPIFGGNEGDSQKIGEQMQNLSEQIGKLQQQLAQKTAEADQLRQQAAQNSGSAVALQDAEAQLEVLRKQVADLQSAQQAASAAPAPAPAPYQGSVTLGAEEERVKPGGLAVGATAYVTRAGGMPLRLRSGPSLNDSILDRLQPGTQMTLLEGPRDADGHAWWHIRASDGREGWVAGEDLRTQPD